MSYMCKWHFKASWTEVITNVPIPISLSFFIWSSCACNICLLHTERFPLQKTQSKNLCPYFAVKSFIANIDSIMAHAKTQISALFRAVPISTMLSWDMFSQHLFIWWNDFLLMIMEKVVKALLLHYSNEKDARRNCFLIVAWSA